MSEIKKTKEKESFAPIGKVSNRWGWGFVSISVIMISVLVFIPMIQSFLLSLQSGQGNQLTFAGLSNYKRMLTDTTFRKALVNTFLYLLVQVPVMIILALFISVLLNDKKAQVQKFLPDCHFLTVCHLAGFLLFDYEEHLLRRRFGQPDTDGNASHF